MAKKTVENQQPMSEAREAINDNFTELYNQLGGGGSSYGGGGSPTTNVKLKEYIDSFSQLGFDPPDAIIVKDQYNRMTVRHLQFVDSDMDQTWQFLYRMGTNTGSSDYHVRFDNADGGPQDTASAMLHADFDGKNLKWFVDNGYAIYSGGSTGGDTWGVFDGTESGVGPGDMLTIQAGNNIQSIEYIGTGMYEVTVINPMPSEFYHVSVGVNPSGYGGADGGASDDANGTYNDLKPTASKFRIDIRDNNNQQSNSDRITFHVVC